MGEASFVFFSEMVCRPAAEPAVLPVGFTSEALHRGRGV